MVKANHPVIRDNSRVSSLRDAMELAVRNGLELQDDPDPYGFAAELEESYGFNILDDQNWNSKPDDDLWVKRLRARGRMYIAAKLSLDGYSEVQIAKRLGVSEILIRNDLNAVGKEWKARYLEMHEESAVKDLARLDYYLGRLAPGIESGDVQSIRAAVDIIKQRGEMMGYRQGIQMDAELIVRRAAESYGLDPDRAVEVAAKVAIHLKN